MSSHLPQLPALDPSSRTVVVRFCVELAWFGAIASAPLLAGLSTQAEAVTALGTYCSFAALLRVFVAARHGEKPWAPNLNNWDECLGLVGATTLAYAAAHLLA